MSAKTAAALMTTVVLWASSFVAIRICLHHFSPGPLALLRYVTASLAMVCVNLRVCVRHPIKSHHWPKLIIIGMVGFTVYNLALNSSEVFIPASIASFVVGLIPVFTLIFAYLFFRETIPVRALLGLAISIVGILIIAVSHHHIHLTLNTGLLLALVAAMAASFYAVFQKPLLQMYPTTVVAAYAIWFGTMFLLIYSAPLLSELATASRSEVLWALYLGIFPGMIAYSTWSYALSHLPASQASTAIYAMPFVTTIMGFFMGEFPQLYTFAGGVVAIIGAYIVHYYCHIQKTQPRHAS